MDINNNQQLNSSQVYKYVPVNITPLDISSSFEAVYNDYMWLTNQFNILQSNNHDSRTVISKQIIEIEEHQDGLYDIICTISKELDNVKNKINQIDLKLENMCFNINTLMYDKLNKQMEVTTKFLQRSVVNVIYEKGFDFYNQTEEFARQAYILKRRIDIDCQYISEDDKLENRLYKLLLLSQNKDKVIEHISEPLVEPIYQYIMDQLGDITHVDQIGVDVDDKQIIDEIWEHNVN
jgi:hypothetical protein